MRMLFLSAGHNHVGDSGAIGVGGIRECDLTSELRDLIAQHIPKENLFLDKDSWTLAKTVDAIDKYPSTEEDIILDIHFNSSDNPKATGTEVIIPTDHTEKEKEFADMLCEVVATILGIRDRGTKTEDETQRKRLAMMRPKGTNAILEVCFISNPSDIASYNNHKSILAEEVARKLHANS